MQDFLKKLEQEHIFYHLKKLSGKDKKILLSQIKQFSVASLLQQKKDFSLSEKLQDNFSFLKRCSFPSQQEEKEGEKILEKGKLALIMMAAGDGIRLGFSKPKGCFPITPITKKSLFQVFAEKIIAAQKKYRCSIPMAIMVSPINAKKTIVFFQKNHFFGLSRENIFFFEQGLLPFFDEKGRWFFATKNKLAAGPDGNGDLFFHFYRSGIWNEFERRNIKYLSLFSVDNPLLNPMQSSLIGHHKIRKNEITLRAIKKEKNMGLLAKKEGKIQVVEYIYFQNKREKQEENFRFANANNFIINMSFVKKVKRKTKDLRYHFIRKKQKFLRKEKFIYKSEKFLFDNFIFAGKMGAVFFQKEECFAPLKRKEDIALVKQNLVKRDRQILSEILGKKIFFKKRIELSQEFYFPSKKLIEKCQKNTFPLKGYIQESDLV